MQKIMKYLNDFILFFRTYNSIFLYGLFFILMLVTISHKVNYHPDEIASYMLANSSRPFQYIITEKTYKPSKDVYVNNMYVSHENRFDYSNVWRNQAKDVHPPFYYAILHTLCSVFYKNFNDMHVASINIIFALLTLYVLRKLIKELTNNDKYIVTAISITFILSSGILSAVSFFRMYIMAMFLVTLLSLLLVKEIDKEKIDNIFLIKFYLIVFSSILTHYYCMIYISLISMVFCLYLLKDKKIRFLFTFILTGIAALISSYLVFPAMIIHIFYSYRGLESHTNLLGSPSEYLTKIKDYYCIVNTEFFGGFLGWIASVFCVFIINCILKKNINGNLKSFAKKYALIFIPCLGYFFIISKIAVLVTTRYMYPIYAVMIMLVLNMMMYVIFKVVRNKIIYICIAMVLSFIVINEYKSTWGKYLYRKEEHFLQNAKNYKDVDSLFVFDHIWKTVVIYNEIQSYRSITFIHKSSLENLQNLEIANQKELVVLVVDDNQEIIKKIMSAYPQLSKYKKIGNYIYSSSYYLYAD